MNATHPLGELIQSAQDRNGWSTRDLERRAERLGLDMAHSNFSRLKIRELVSIKGSTIRALSEVLEVSEVTVAQAALASMGISLPENRPPLEDVVRDAQELSTRDRRLVQSLLGAMRDFDADTGQERGGNADSTAPMNQEAATASAPQPPHDPNVHLASKKDTTAGATVHQLRASDYPDNNIPLPQDWDTMAAHPHTDSESMREHAAGIERGEDSQDTEHHN